MSKFVPRWSHWKAMEGARPEVETANQEASKTCKSPFAGFAGSLGRHSEVSTGLLDRPRSASSVQDRSSHDSEMGRIEAMDLAAFARAGLIVRVHSEVLGCDVLFVSDNVEASVLAGNDLPIYPARELRKLAVLGPEPHDLRCIHEVKTIFNGAITDVRPFDDRDRNG